MGRRIFVRLNLWEASGQAERGIALFQQRNFKYVWLELGGPMLELRLMRFTTFSLLLFGCAATIFAALRVSLTAVPQHGVAPDAEIDGKGTIHLVYTVGENVFYAKSSADGAAFG